MTSRTFQSPPRPLTTLIAASLARITVAWWIALVLLTPATLAAQVNILTNRYDAQRTGANLKETSLTAANVNVTRFGKLYSYPVDGAVYAQPLYVQAVGINGSTHNVLYVATMNDKLYAFDADSSSAVPLWVRDFTNPPSVTAVPITDIVAANLNIIGNVGIQSTPVIDDVTGTLYLIARTKESGEYLQRLHAIDIATGNERTGSPVAISGSVPGTAADSTPGTSGRVIPFDPRMQAQRTGLALSNGVVLVAWGSHEDATPYHGWMMGFDAATLTRVSIYAVTPDFYGAGIWQGGRAPAIDASGNAYFATGNGKWDGTSNFGDSLLKFGVSRSGLVLNDFFTPGNEADLYANDDDLSGSGFTVLPGTNLLLGGGKEGVLYLIDANHLGHRVANDTQIVQRIPVSGGHVMGGPVFWSSSSAGPLVYNWSEDDVLRAYRLSNGRLETPAYAQGQVVSPGHPGGSLTLSANGVAEGTGIVWASLSTNRDGVHGLVAGILRAFNADTLAEIWSSEDNPGRDRVGTLMKFVPPVVVSGRVYLPNQDGAIAVYGLIPPDFAVTATPSNSAIAPGGVATFSISVSAVAGFTGAVGLEATGCPSGATVTFSPQSISGSGVATMTVAMPANAAPGTFQIAVAGTSGTLVRSAAPVVVNVTTASGESGAIGINFVGTNATAMSAAETAGAIPQTHWNNASGGSRSVPLALVDETGAAIGATVTWASNTTWATPITDQAGDGRMMKGYLDTSNTSTTTITVSGLRSRTYDVYVYADGDNRTYSRTGAYTITGPGITTTTVTLSDRASTNFSGTFTQAGNSIGNYVKFSVTGGEFTITASPTLPVSGTRRAPVNGLQIVPSTISTSAPAISVSFTGSSTSTMAAGDTAGVVVAAHWNDASGAARSAPLALVDAAGSPTGATITWGANGIWATGLTDSAGNNRMMRGYLDTSSTSTTAITVTGLSQGAYDVYVYADGANGAYSRTAAYTIAGPGITTTTIQLIDAANTNFAGGFTRASNSAGNYVRFSIDAGGFTITAKPVSGTNATLRAPVNGIQIVPRF
jgi:hypothetical protein